MAERIKGITIQFKGDTAGLDKALKEIQSESKSVDSELQKVNKALKFNPHNTELLSQKFTLLKQKIDVTENQLKEFRNAEEQLKAQGVSRQSTEWMTVRRKIIETESKLQHFNAELQKVKYDNIKRLGDSFKTAGDKMKSAGRSMTTSVTAPITGAFALSANLASDYEENMNKIDVAFGKSSNQVKKWADNARDQFGLSKVAASDAVSAFGALGKGIGLSESDAATMSTTLAGLSADLASYFNTGTDESAKALEGIFTGESEALKKFGVVMTDTNLQKFAEDQGLVWKEMSQSEKTALRYQYVLEKTKDAQGDYARTSDGTANSIKTFKAALEDLGTAIGTQLLPIITPIVQKLTEWIQKFADLDPKTQKIITIIGIVVGALGPLLMIIGSIASGIGAIMTVVPMLGGAFAALAGPVGIAIAIIGGLVLAGIAVYKNWDKIKEFASKVWNGIKDAISGAIQGIVKWFDHLKLAVGMRMHNLWETVKGFSIKVANALTAPIRKAVDFIKNMIQKIKGFFNFKVHLPKIKLPHFSIDPPGWKLSDLLQGEIPSLGIKWYKQGGIFNSPSVIGVGEAGPEAVLPIEKLQGMMMAMADSIVNGVGANMALQGASMTGEIKIVNYLYPNGPKMGEETVRMYDLYKGRLG